MLAPTDRWIWDFWHVEHDGVHHLYYLQASKSLGDPELRHRNATVGHATSTDLRNWTEHGTILEPGGAGKPDATATWTGSVVRADDGLWWMFYTGSTFLTEDGHANVEVITAACSSDLHIWVKHDSLVLCADPRWYETLGTSAWPEEAWRDPWVFRDGDNWRMLITARANDGDLWDRGVVGHATSPDLQNWEVEPPLTSPGEGFAHLEVFQVTTVENQRMLVFSAHETVLSASRTEAGATSGTFAAPWTDGIDLEHAVNLAGPDLYSGRVVDTESGPVLLAFLLVDDEGQFIGGICDPIAIEITGGRLSLVDNAIDR
ncbi:glycosyl hydrolase family 32 [uncultured Microbacterium sp.]|uniref:glycosyl hydrolase family 32 n=1 Tax=uncultured Microbacterium sp. TaxID=191216 RepID=UPI0028E6838A|nr:glycosyl hydrolase family 32 [uncultured Microbacterium sp.]